VVVVGLVVVGLVALSCRGAEVSLDLDLDLDLVQHVPSVASSSAQPGLGRLADWGIDSRFVVVIAAGPVAQQLVGRQLVASFVVEQDVVVARHVAELGNEPYPYC